MWQKTKNYYHFLSAILANLLYGIPSRNLIVVGVTGTDGKTTTVSLIYHILKTSKLNVSMISSIGAIINGKKYPLPFHVTTPSSFALQKFLKITSKSKSPRSKNFLILEVTSHALDQFRAWGINFNVGVLTNITHEHLDYHKSYENYVMIKAKLLKIAKTAVINMDDESYKMIRKMIPYHKLVTYGFKNAMVNIGDINYKHNLIGDFNKYNILAAVGACRALGIPENDIKNGIETFLLPAGRQEIVYKEGFEIMIDFAHTPNSFEKILVPLREKVMGRIIHVFGSAGERDASKRPKMGKISAKYSDIMILTAEDPRSEPSENIIKDIESEIINREAKIKNGEIKEIHDRQEAISHAISLAQRGDLILITGKAHEKSMNYGNGEIAWDEYEAVKRALTLRKLPDGKN
ncbi:MAG: UDP-N-acetylmuramoyl-L-alanyl-D-glutamate--2,6-diaminopimelate ligase [Candidatus Levybacteria bacterium]|nr:UDP-N-acetylmuramoyl-L-alanyl-D-glutamate--2,6-diaminopimelate ligase [Candidatus Levybacteria bacterium]